MGPTDAALLDALADCLQAGDTLPEALGKVAMVGRAAERWTEQVRRSGTLRRSNALDGDEIALLPAEDTDAAVAASLHAVALRRRRRLARRRAILWGLVGPFGFAALAIVLDPLPNLVTDQPYFWPVLRGLLLLAVVALVVVAGPPALAGRPRARAAVLRFCGAVPGLRWFAALHAEEELTTALAAFAVGDQVPAAGLSAGASPSGSPSAERRSRCCSLRAFVCCCVSAPTRSSSCCRSPAWSAWSRADCPEKGTRSGRGGIAI